MDTKKIEAYEDMILTLITFLGENEQYGDDWSEEIDGLENLLDDIQWYLKQGIK